ncbi:MAG: lipoate--protein ligase [Spirochaetota bacterium]|nr:lipoate--protein ligase [Spirochaetota bacterium]
MRPVDNTAGTYNNIASMTSESWIIESPSHDPWLNLALEEYLFHTLGQNQTHIVLYTNRDSVIIGRNQNPDYECSLSLLEKENIRLARRFTGGGAVFTDMGCLNFSFIMDKSRYDLSKHFSIITKELSELGIPCETSEGRDLLVGGNKVSGNAFSYQKDKAIHHGTLLVTSDIDRLNNCLTMSQHEIPGVKAVRSRPATVANLSQYHEGLTITSLLDQLYGVFSREFSCTPICEAELYEIYSCRELRDIYTRLSSNMWILRKIRE